MASNDEVFEDHGPLCFNRCKLSEAPNFHCKRCNIAVYCSDLCQKEHWHLGHKAECEFLRGKEELSKNSFHDDKKCKRCKKKFDRMKVIPCPYWKIKKSTQFYEEYLFRDLYYGAASKNPLPVKGLYLFNRMNIPFQLGEFTGNYVTPIDQIFGDMLTLCACFDIHDEWYSHPSQRLDFIIMRLRVMHWSYILNNNDVLSEVLLHSGILTSMKPVRIYLRDASREIKCIWDVFLLKLNLLFDRVLQYTARPKSMSKRDKALKVIEDFRSSESVTIDDFKKLKILVLNEVYGEVKIQREDGSITLTCSSCLKNFDNDIQALDFIPHIEHTIDDPLKKASIFVHHATFCPIAFCGSESCKCAVAEAYSKDPVEGFYKSGHECDHCHHRVEEVHRCSGCKCMSYCSRDCQLKDWESHKKVCKMYKDLGYQEYDKKARKKYLQVQDKDNENTIEELLREKVKLHE